VTISNRLPARRRKERVSKPSYQVRLDNAVLRFTGEEVPQKVEFTLLCESLFDLLDGEPYNEKEIVYE
jgi:hypothetical protein